MRWVGAYVHGWIMMSWNEFELEREKIGFKG